MTVTEHGYTTEQARDLSRAGMEQCLDKMAATFAVDRQISGERARWNLSEETERTYTACRRTRARSGSSKR